MSESGMRGKVIRVLKPLDAVAVENRVGIGTPDVECVNAWLELKWLRKWPKGEDTPVVLDHYTPQQKLWIRRRTLAGGKVFLLLQCKREWLLFKHPETMAVGQLTRSQLYSAALAFWKEGLNAAELMEILR